MVGWSDGAGLTSSTGASYIFDNSRAKPTALAVGAGGGCLGSLPFPFFLSLSLSLSLSLGEGPMETEILSQRAVKTQNNQPIKKS